MGLLLDAGTGGALRGLRDTEPDVGAVQLPEAVELPAGQEDTEDDRAQMLVLRRQMLERTNRPARSSPPPRGHRRPN